MKISLYSPEECGKIALSAELRYVHDGNSWIIRKKNGNGFVYLHSDGTKLTNQKDLKRVRGLAIPPAFTIARICPYANGHIQATWRDSKNRKQYLYHPYWQEARQKQKFDSMILFGQSISLIRKHIYRVLNQEPTLSKKQIICAILYLLDNSCIRIGNSIYAEENS